jgi:glycosyltransferase involved in cell wall biosynthesis
MKPANSNRLHKSILLIGPLPPPFGGARVSFQLFYDFIGGHSNETIKYFDLPVRTKRNTNQTGKVNHLKTIIWLIRALLFVPFCRSAVIFGSRGFCFSYGIIICAISRIMRKRCFIRFFGGRPIPHLKKYPCILRKFIFLGLRPANKISIATKIGASEFPEVLRRKVEIIPGYRPLIHSNLSQRHSTSGTFRFLYAGIISKEKGIDILLKSFSELHKESVNENSFELHLFGQNFGYTLEKMNGVYYHGIIENTILRQQLASYDAFVFPTIYDNEGHPGVLIEALMAGLPIISSDQPVIREFLVDNHNSLLVKAGDIQGLYKAMAQVANDFELRQKLSEAALETSARFDATKVLPALANVFEL